MFASLDREQEPRGHRFARYADRFGKGGWQSAKCHGIEAALGLTYLKQQGLFSLRDGWIAGHHGG